MKWKRETKADITEPHTGSILNKEGEKVKYHSRLLACTRCGTEQETKEKQLKCKEGFRAIHCKKCGKQERVHSNMCRCKIIWHHCPLHKTDPLHHNQGKAKKKGNDGKAKEGKKTGAKSSTRNAPLIQDAVPPGAKRQALGNPSLHAQAPRNDLLLRVRVKEAKRKALEA